jgi:nicotinamidase-related amidase
MPGWDAFLTEQDKAHLAYLGPRAPKGFGENPCVLVIDDYYSVLGLERLPILESIKTWPMSCGLEGWEAIDKTVELLAMARSNGIPVIYCHGLEDFNAPWASRRKTSKRSDRMSLSHLPEEMRRKANEIVEEIAPQPGDLVIKKAAASVFQGTAINFHLNYEGIDTIIACGETTSGCVRASVVDGATYRFHMGVVEECCFDRTQASHWINLFDMNQKYADVIDRFQAGAYFESIAAKAKVLVAVG